VVEQSSESASVSTEDDAVVASEAPDLSVSVSKTEPPAASPNQEPPTASPNLVPSADVTVQGAAAMSVAETTAVTAQPVTVPPSLTRASAIVSSKTRRTAELPKRILKMMDRESRITAQTLFLHPPILAGQSVDEYYDIVEAVMLDYRPYFYRELALVKQIADEEWKITTFGSVQKELLNAAIGKGLMDQIADADEGPSEDRQIRMRAWRRIVFGAISGDPEMDGLLAKELGVGSLGLNVYSARHLVDDVRAHIFADNTMNAALRRRDGAVQQLEKISQDRHQRLMMRMATAEDVRAMQANLGVAEYAKLSITRRRFAEEGSAEGAPTADQTGPGAQNPALDQKKITGPQT